MHQQTTPEQKTANACTGVMSIELCVMTGSLTTMAGLHIISNIKPDTGFKHEEIAVDEFSAKSRGKISGKMTLTKQHARQLAIFPSNRRHSSNVSIRMTRNELNF